MPLEWMAPRWFPRAVKMLFCSVTTCPRPERAPRAERCEALTAAGEVVVVTTHWVFRFTVLVVEEDEHILTQLQDMRIPL